MIQLGNRILTSTAITMRLGVFLALIAGALASAPAAAEVLASWNPAGTIDMANPLPPASVSPNVTSAGNLTGGPGLTTPGYSPMPTCSTTGLPAPSIPPD